MHGLPKWHADFVHPCPSLWGWWCPFAGAFALCLRLWISSSRFCLLLHGRLDETEWGRMRLFCCKMLNIVLLPDAYKQTFWISALKSTNLTFWCRHIAVPCPVELLGKKITLFCKAPGWFHWVRLVERSVLIALSPPPLPTPTGLYRLLRNRRQGTFICMKGQCHAC